MIVVVIIIGNMLLTWSSTCNAMINGRETEKLLLDHDHRIAMHHHCEAGAVHRGRRIKRGQNIARVTNYLVVVVDDISDFLEVQFLINGPGGDK